ncbi:ATP-binding protein [Planomonospora sp. ID82291]|uniref:ATP-binding protein n=1 Tax=Planomonospora sp. ID82291 TaxID=2738136 RepID=UPI0018C3A07E|nr:ATP-binding protein [Planomonospora sp. ID82291]MBG0817563.1 sensor histidine kinase [Planomonospora sp. ID82291]
MIEHVVAEVLLSSGLAAACGALVVRTRGRNAAVRARRTAEDEVVKARIEAARDLEKAQLRFAQDTEELRRQITVNAEWYQTALEETRHLVGQRLPAALDAEARSGSDAVVPGLLHPLLKGTPFEELHQAAEDLLREALQSTRAGVGRAARAGVRGMADEAQAFLTRLQIKIDEELDRHPAASAYHQSLIDIDHVATRSLHAVQRLRILTGSWPGTQRADCTFREIVESARGRIGPYDRVEHTYLPEVGELFVEGRVVEPIVVALTELLANATDYSSDPVGVYVQRVQAGYRIVVEDTGLGMNHFQRTAAERMLAHRAVFDVTTLEDERRLGFAVIGRLTHDYGFRVDVSAPSAGGGVKAVLVVPDDLMSRSAAEAPSPPAAREAPSAPPAGPLGVPGVPGVPGLPDTAGLPDTVGLPGALAGSAAGAAPTAGSASAEHTGHPGPAEADLPLTTVLGLPKRQPKDPRAAPRPSSPSQEALTDSGDPAALAEGFEQMRRALSAGYGDSDTDPGGRLPS